MFDNINVASLITQQMWNTADKFEDNLALTACILEYMLGADHCHAEAKLAAVIDRTSKTRLAGQTLVHNVLLQPYLKHIQNLVCTTYVTLPKASGAHREEVKLVEETAAHEEGNQPALAGPPATFGRMEKQICSSKNHRGGRGKA